MAAPWKQESGTTVTPLDIVMHGGDPARRRFAGLLERRIDREPLQWILGRAPVMGIDIEVGPGVFIPRPETDLLIDWVAGEAERRVARREHGLFSRLLEPTLTVVDLCSGPGTIALGVAHELTLTRDPGQGVGARGRTGDHRGRGRPGPRQRPSLGCRGPCRPPDRVEFHQRRRVAAGGRHRPRAGELRRHRRLQPPVRPRESTEVSPEVARDPHDAVFSGDDGLALMRPLAGVIDLVASTSAGIAVEHDDSTGQAVHRLLADVGVTDLVQHRDMAGRDRFVTGQVHRDPGHRPVRD
jgi:release factor glutamine methyltransferase